MDLAILDQTSERFLGQWQRLVSTTNWEKGRIIHEWRNALVEADAGSAEYSDEAWSRQVGNVTPQHTGRLRRVFERFGSVRENYSGLYWSHFQAALDWSDAEMWLEGAVQNDWSIATMRQNRLETLGEVSDSEADQQELSTELDEDAEPIADDATSSNALEPSLDVVRSANRSEAVDEAEDWQETDSDENSDVASEFVAENPIRPFANLASLPVDVSEAFEAFKLCILKHKLAGWGEIAREDLLGALDALKELALTPTQA